MAGPGATQAFTPNSTFAYVHRVDRLRLGIMLGSYFGLGLKYGRMLGSGRYYVQDGEASYPQASTRLYSDTKSTTIFPLVAVLAQFSGRFTIRSLLIFLSAVAATEGSSMKTFVLFCLN